MRAGTCARRRVGIIVEIERIRFAPRAAAIVREFPAAKWAGDNVSAKRTPAMRAGRRRLAKA